MKKKEFIQELEKHQKLSKGQKGIVCLNNNILIRKTGEHSCELQSSDLSISMKTVCEYIEGITFFESFTEAIVDPDVIIKFLSKNDCLFEIADDKIILNGSIKLNYIDSQMFPYLPDVSGIENLVQVELEVLKRLSNYCGNDVTNQMYSGINFQNEYDGDDVVAVTDARIIAHNQYVNSHIQYDENRKAEYNFTIPNKVVKLLTQPDVVIKFNDRYSVIQDGNTELIVSNYQGTYPHYQVVYKKMHKNTYSMKLSDIEAFLGLVDNDCTILAIDFSRRDTVVLEYISEIDYSKITQEYPCQIFQNDPERDLIWKIGLNPKYLKKYIKASVPKTCENFVMRIGSAIEPVHFSYDNVVLMPLRLED